MRISTLCAPVEVVLGPEPVEALSARAAKLHVPVSAVLLAAFQSMLQDRFGSPIYLSTTLPLTDATEHGRVLGPAFTYGLVPPLPGGVDPWAAADHLGRTMAAAREHAHHADTIGPHGSRGTALPPDRVALFGFNTAPRQTFGVSAYAGTRGDQVAIADTLSVRPVTTARRRLAYGLFLRVMAYGHSLDATLYYDVATFDHGRARALLNEWCERIGVAAITEAAA